MRAGSDREPMRILLAGTGLQIGGAERMVLVLARALLRSGHEVAISGAPGPLENELLPLPVQLLRLDERGRSPAGVARSAVSLAAFLRSFRPHVVHAHNPKAAITAAIAARLGLGPRRPPLIATVHGLDPADYRIGALVLRAVADRVVCVSEDVASHLALSGVSAEIVQNGVDLEPPLSPGARAAIDQELALAGGPVVTAVGRLATDKNHDRFLVAAAEILRGEPEARFLLVGDGPLRSRLEHRATALGIAERVRFTGARADARALIARSDLLLVSSDREGLSVAALEGLAAGTPVVSTPVEGMRALLAGGGGVISGDRTASSLARAALELLADASRREALGAAGAHVASERFASDAMVEAYDRLYAVLSRGEPA